MTDDLKKIHKLINQLIWHKSLPHLGNNILPKILSLCFKQAYLDSFIFHLQESSSNLSEADRESIYDLINLINQIAQVVQKNTNAQEYIKNISISLCKLSTVNDLVTEAINQEILNIPKEETQLEQACERLKENLSFMEFGGADLIKLAAMSQPENVISFCSALKESYKDSHFNNLFNQVIEDFQLISRQCFNNDQKKQYVFDQARLACEISAVQHFFEKMDLKHG